MIFLNAIIEFAYKFLLFFTLSSRFLKFVRHINSVDLLNKIIFRPPFTSSSSEKIYRTILIGFDQLLWPKYISNDVISLIRNLCCHNFEQRLGYRNIDEIRSHRWFSTFNFESFRNSSMTPPIVPTVYIFYNCFYKLFSQKFLSVS